jgi:hypothetical protein
VRVDVEQVKCKAAQYFMELELIPFDIITVSYSHMLTSSLKCFPYNSIGRTADFGRWISAAQWSDASRRA